MVSSSIVFPKLALIFIPFLNKHLVHINNCATSTKKQEAHDYLPMTEALDASMSSARYTTSLSACVL